ncbi:hypothetical protein GCM10010276_00230 [Streptomyces longisporus]|uniref:Uncharacterized protein n=1 Tax=Streptomyces longisporus TaxID=1948 RepID=A0ABN3KUL6_STRLO
MLVVMCPSWIDDPCTPAPHPALSAAYARLNRTFPGPAVREVGADERVPTGDGRVSAASPAQGGVDLDTFLAPDDTQMPRDYGVHGRTSSRASGCPGTHGPPVR